MKFSKNGVYCYVGGSSLTYPHFKYVIHTLLFVKEKDGGLQQIEDGKALAIMGLWYWTMAYRTRGFSLWFGPSYLAKIKLYRSTKDWRYRLCIEMSLLKMNVEDCSLRYKDEGAFLPKTTMFLKWLEIMIQTHPYRITSVIYTSDGRELLDIHLKMPKMVLLWISLLIWWGEDCELARSRRS